MRRQPRWAQAMEERLRAFITETGWNIVTALDDRIATLEADLTALAQAIQTEISQLADAGVPQSALDRLDALANQATSLTAALAADDLPPAA